MITVISLHQKHGYSGYDHLLGADGSQLGDLVGSDWPSMRALRKAVFDAQKNDNDPRCGWPPVEAVVIIRGHRTEVTL